MNEYQDKLELQNPQPSSAEILYSTKSRVYQKNRYLQDTMNMEKKWETKYWSIRINMCLVPINMVDSHIKLSQSTVDTYIQGQLYTDFYKIS